MKQPAITNDIIDNSFNSKIMIENTNNINNKNNDCKC